MAQFVVCVVFPHKYNTAMKNIFDGNVKDEVLNRLDNLKVNSVRNWGGMTVTQMLAHCTRSIKIANGETKLKRVFIGRIIGPFFKSQYYNDKPYPKNIKLEIAAFVPDKNQFAIEKNKLKQIIKAFSEGGQCTKHPHPLFGYFTIEQWGKAVYKHLDHHLRQFNG